MNNFYVYRYIRLDTMTPFYIGKGKGRRLFSMSKRNSHFTNIVKKTPVKVEIFIKNLTEEQAFLKEIEYIKLYRSFGYKLANMTDGGEGTSGHVRSEEEKTKISDSMKIVSAPRKGKPLTAAIKKSAELRKGKDIKTNNEPVLCIETNKEYRSMRDAAKDIGSHPNSVSVSIRKGIKVKGLTFKYLNGKKIRPLYIFSDKERNRKISDKQKKKKVILSDGQIFSSVKETSIFLKTSTGNVSSAIKDGTKLRGFNLYFYKEQS